MDKETLIAGAAQAFLNGQYASLDEVAEAYGVTKEELIGLVGDTSGS